MFGSIAPEAVVDLREVGLRIDERRGRSPVERREGPRADAHRTAPLRVVIVANAMGELHDEVGLGEQRADGERVLAGGRREGGEKDGDDLIHDRPEVLTQQ